MLELRKKNVLVIQVDQEPSRVQSRGRTGKRQAWQERAVRKRPAARGARALGPHSVLATAPARRGPSFHTAGAAFASRKR